MPKPVCVTRMYLCTFYAFANLGTEGMLEEIRAVVVFPGLLMSMLQDIYA
jgi:hypothetical protein